MITLQTTINAPIETVWECWNEPKHITKWCQASDDWHAPAATNDLRVGGLFSTTMAAKDGSFSFEFGGEYSTVDHHQRIEYTIGDGRKVSIVFDGNDTQTTVTESFDPEKVNPEDMQRQGWQAILDNFKKYTESQHS